MPHRIADLNHAFPQYITKIDDGCTKILSICGWTFAILKKRTQRLRNIKQIRSTKSEYRNSKQSRQGVAKFQCSNVQNLSKARHPTIDPPLVSACPVKSYAYFTGVIQISVVRICFGLQYSISNLINLFSVFSPPRRQVNTKKNQNKSTFVKPLAPLWFNSCASQFRSDRFPCYDSTFCSSIFCSSRFSVLAIRYAPCAMPQAWQTCC